MATEDDSTSIGITLEKFNERTMDFLQWLNTLEQLATSLKIKGRERVNFLYDWLEPSVFPRIQDKISPLNLYTLNYDKLIVVLTEIFTDIKAEDVADHRFLTRVQLPYESVDHYYQSLKKLSSKCSSKYKSGFYYKDIFIKGLHDQDIKEFLKNSNALPFHIIRNIAIHMELKKKDEIGKKEKKIWNKKNLPENMKK